MLDLIYNIIVQRDKGEKLMNALSMKQIFKSVKMMNDLADITNEAHHLLMIYVDDEKIYEGSNFQEYAQICKREYIPTFADYCMNLLFTHYSNKFWDEFGNEHKVEFYIYCK